MRLLDALPLGSFTASNRVLFGPHETNLGDGRALSPRHLAYYARRMAGGAGVVVVEEASVHPSDWPYERCPLASECGGGWADLARAAEPHGTIVLAAVGHSGGQGSSAYSQRELWAPSGVPEVNTREVPKVMETADIAAVVAGFGAAAGLAVRSGLHGVEVNAGQHSLVRQFMSGLTNQRGDDYGVDKLRFASEVLDAVRAAIGPEHLLGLRLSCDELAPWAGITPESAEAIVGALVGRVDYLVVVRGAIFSVAATRPDGHEAPGFNLDLVGRVRQWVDGAVPVFAQGSIVDAGQAEWALEDGRCDGVEMTRAQLADADLVAKLRAGRGDEVRPCVLCNQFCKVRDNRNPIVSCLVDPRTGHETEDASVDLPLVPGAARPMADTGAGVGRPGPNAPGSRAVGTGTRPLVVVGGGPAGLEAARVAALRGRRVRLRERGDRLGGMARVAANGAGRDRLALVVDWLEAECRRLGVEISLGAPGPGDVDADTDVIWAVGGVDAPPAYAVEAGCVVCTAAAYLAGDALPADGPIAVWDPIGGPIAVSVAEKLLAEGRAVTLVTPDLIVGTMLSLSGDLAPANVRLQAGGAQLVRRSSLVRAGPGGLEVEERFSGTRTTLPAVAIVDAGHRLPPDGPVDGDPVGGTGGVAVGDCVAPRTIHDAILDPRRAVLALDERAPATTLAGRR